MPCGTVKVLPPAASSPVVSLPEASEAGLRVPRSSNPARRCRQGWPVKFEGTYEDYTTFTRERKLSERLGAGAAVVKSRWPNAAIQQRVLRYNFRVKAEWPRL